MATGPENYREAERLIAEANHVGHSDPVRASGMLVAAQVHATLALAAATALQPTAYLTEKFRGESALPWVEVAGVPE
jgi:hypothetical protein